MSHSAHSKPFEATVRPRRAPHIEALFEGCGVRAYHAAVEPEFIEQLVDAESNGIESMSQHRRAEFATGRACARAALRELGRLEPVPRLDRSVPAWPDGIVGSISHTQGFCVAVAATADSVASIGIDVEQVGRIKPGIERRILTEPERSALLDMSEPLRHERVAVTFAAKEAFYKAHYQLEPRYLGFDVVAVRFHEPDRLSFEPGSDSVRAELLPRTTGRYLRGDNRVIAGVAIGTDETR